MSNFTEQTILLQWEDKWNKQKMKNDFENEQNHFLNNWKKYERNGSFTNNERIKWKKHQ